ncbi:MAG: ABC transporter permease subunit [Acidimicrobiaceae bacterium]|nr:ABC transporter permease subunit [Acidimicrobiaceae bacterium]
MAGKVSSAAATPTRHSPSRRRRFERWLRKKAWRHAVGWLMIAFALLPLAYMLSAALSTRGTLVGSNKLFSTITLEHFRSLFTTPAFPYGRWWVNSMVVGVVTSLGVLLVSTMAAYVFSRRRFRGRRLGLNLLILIQIFPSFLGVVAVFLLMDWIGSIFPQVGINSHAGLILVYLGGALGANVYLMYGNMNTVPASLDEAAHIDGAGHFRIFWQIIIPLVRPILAVMALLQFIWITGDYVIASVLLSSPDQQTVAVGLESLVAPNNANRGTNWGFFSAGAVAATAPMLVIFTFLQRYIVGGLTAGSVK